MNPTETQIQDAFPIIQDKSLIARIQENARIVSVDANTTILRSGQFINDIPLILHGVVKVSRETASENEVFLYFMAKGDTCAMTLSSCIRRQQSSIRALTLMPTSILLIPITEMKYYIDRFSNWNDFMLKSFHDRFDSVICSFESVSFLSKEDQILRYLREVSRITNSSEVAISHSQLAKDLSSNRVAISKILKKLEKDGILKLGRNRIIVN